MDQLAELTRRLERLENIDAIKSLKARYLMACDTKQPEQMRDCFIDGPVLIDYGPAGKFGHRDELVAIFEEIGCHPHMLEMHHGHNPQIKLVDSDNAEGTWELCYQLINTDEKTLTQLVIIYYDKYQRVAGDWKISETITKNISTLVMDISEAVPKVIVAASPES